MGGACGMYGEKQYTSRPLEPEGKRPLGRLSHKWEGNIKNVVEIGWVGVNWISLAEGRDRWRTVVNTVMNHRIYQHVHLTELKVITTFGCVMCVCWYI
jgi:hypothetical protein